MHKINFWIVLIIMVFGFDHRSFALFGSSNPKTCTDKNMPEFVKKQMKDNLMGPDLNEGDSDYKPCKTHFNDIKAQQNNKYEITALTKCKSTDGEIDRHGEEYLEFKKQIYFTCTNDNKKVKLQDLPKMMIKLENGSSGKQYHLIATYD